MLLETSYQRWLSERSAKTLRLVKSHIAQNVASDTLRARMTEAVNLSRCAKRPDRYQAPIHLPLLAHAAVKGDDETAIPVAAVCAMLWIGAELYDHLTDGDLPTELKRYRDHEIVMTLASLSCVLPTPMLAELPLASELRVRMQRTLTDGTLEMFAGQEQDLRFTNTSAVSPEPVAASVVAKNGAAKSLFARLGAEMAGATTEQAEAYAAFGRALGTVYQLQSDLYEMYYSPWCRDLAHGTRTLQIAICLELLSDADREDFLALLDRARTEPAAQTEVRNRLLQARFMRPWTAVVQEHVSAAEAALDVAAPREPAGSLLRRLLRAKSPKCM